MTNEEMQRLTEVEQRSKTNTHAIAELKEELKEVQNEQKAIYEINANIKLMAQSVASVKEDVSDMKEDISNTNKEVKDDIGKVKERISNIENKPDKDVANAFRKYRDTIIALIVTGVAAFVLGQVCPMIFG